MIHDDLPSCNDSYIPIEHGHKTLLVYPFKVVSFHRLLYTRQRVDMMTDVIEMVGKNVG